MARLGTAWHLPGSAESAAEITMRSPVFPTLATRSVRIFSGNQSEGDGGADQWQTGSFLSYRRSKDLNWKLVPLEFSREIEKRNNKYFVAEIPLTGFEALDQVLYYLVLAYEPRERAPTYLGVVQNDPSSGWSSQTLRTEAEAQASPFTFTIGVENAQNREYPKNQQKTFAYPYLKGDRTIRGEWGPVFPLPNVGAHASLLRTGKVLMWGRRDNPIQSMNTYPAVPPNRPPKEPATCTPFLLDPDTQSWKFTKQPFTANDFRLNTNLPRNKDGKNANANLFCSGHSFLADGKLLVAGGHLRDGRGLDQACKYDPGNDTWEAVSAKTDGVVMGRGRWYPTVVTLPTGTALVASGSDEDGNNVGTQILSTAEFASVQQNSQQFDLYPLMHVASSGFVYWISLTDRVMRMNPNDNQG